MKACRRSRKVKDSDNNNVYMGKGLLEQIEEYQIESNIQKNYAQILNDMTWSINSASTNAYSTSSGVLYEPSGILTYRDFENYCKEEEKEKEQKERVDNIMNKYGLI